MSASNCPETPRQKMIQMMYLVYTAMLALNVSAEVLNGFTTVGTAMDKSNYSIGQKTNDSYEQFARAYENNPDKTREQYNKAMEVQKISKAMKYYIDTLSYGFICYIQSDLEITAYQQTDKIDRKTGHPKFKKDKANSKKIHISDGKTKKGDNGYPEHWQIDTVKSYFRQYGMDLIKKKDDNHEGVNYFFGGSKQSENPPEDCRIMVFKKKLLDYRHRLNEILGDDSVLIKNGIDVDGLYLNSEGKQMTWEQLNFNETITIACMVVLSRIRADVMTAEYDAVKMLYNQVSSNDFKFDKVTTITKPVSSYVVKGGTYEAQIGIGAFDSRAEFEVVVNGRSFKSDESGMVKYTAQCGAAGEQHIRGKMYVKKDNNTEEYEFDEAYFVAEPMATVSLTAMNVVYAGIDNPISVSVPGYDSRFIRLVDPAGGAEIKPAGKAGQYTIRCKGGQNGRTYKLNLKVLAKTDAKSPEREMGSFEYKVKPIPSPILMLNTYKSGARVPKGDFEAAVLRANIEGFDLDIDKSKLKISEYQYQVTGSGKAEATARGSSIDPELKSLIKKARKGDKVLITAKVTTPDGVPHTMEASFRIQ